MVAERLQACGGANTATCGSGMGCSGPRSRPVRPSPRYYHAMVRRGRDGLWCSVGQLATVPLAICGMGRLFVDAGDPSREPAGALRRSHGVRCGPRPDRASAGMTAYPGGMPLADTWNGMGIAWLQRSARRPGPAGSTRWPMTRARAACRWPAVARILWRRWALCRSVGVGWDGLAARVQDPGGRFRHAMAFDWARTASFGGIGGGGTDRDDTWLGRGT